VAAALGGGGATIASAPELPRDQQVLGGQPAQVGVVPTEFWRVKLLAADHVKIDYGVTNHDQLNEGVRICVLAPSVTDYTQEGANCQAESSTDSKRELTWSAPSAGRYTLRVDTNGCGGCELAYELTGSVRHFTALALHAPGLVRAHAKVRLTGKVSGANSGSVQLRIQRKAQHAWKVIGSAALSETGAFHLTTHATGRGSYRIRAFFRGDRSHLPSHKVILLKVE